PERNVHPFLRKSHIPAYSVRGADGSIVMSEHPVDAFPPARTLVQLFPPSVVRYTPRSSLSLHALPGTQAKTVFVFVGSMRILAMCSELSSPIFVQFSPPSVDL